MGLWTIARDEIVDISCNECRFLAAVFEYRLNNSINGHQSIKIRSEFARRNEITSPDTACLLDYIRRYYQICQLLVIINW